MTRFTLSAAARVCGCDRRTLQRAVQAGRLTLDAQHCLSREALVAAGYLDAPTPQGTPHETPLITPQETPHGAALVPQGTPHVLEHLMTLLAAIAEDLHALRERLVPRRATVTPLERSAAAPPQVTPQVTPHAAPLPQEAPHGDAASLPHHDTLTPHDPPQYTPQSVADMPQGTPHEPATPASAPTLPAHILTIAEVAAQYDKLTLVDLSQLLYDRGIYRSTDRTTGDEKPVHKGTLTRWLERARQAGVL